MKTSASFVVVVLVFLVAIAAAASFTPNARFQSYCNFPCPAKYDCPNLQAYGIAPCNVTQTGGCNSDTPRGCWSQGAFPTLSKDGKVTNNGGLPQLANITYHIEKMAAEIDRYMPEKDFDGNAVLDFEAWTPVWNQDVDGGNGQWHGLIYQLESIALVKKQHPDWTNLTLITETAKKDFETAGLNFFVQTLKYLKSVRPKAKWGYYGMPQALWGSHCGENKEGEYKCGYQSPTAGSYFQNQNDAIGELWTESVALYPSVYLMPGNGAIWEALQKINVQDVTQESVRLAKTYGDKNGTRTPVMPFYWNLYHNGTTYISPEDVSMTVEQSYQPPHAVGTVMWGSIFGKTIAKLPEYIKTTEGPIFEAAQKNINQYASEVCSGHGWALNPFNGTVAAKAGGCVCDAGFSGSDCNTSV